MSRPALPRLARYTLHHHGPAALLDGLVAGIIGLAPFVVKRSLGASEAIVPLLVTIGQTAWIFAPAVAPYLARNDPQRSWNRIALLAHLPLLLIALVAVEPRGSGGRGEGTLWLFLLAISSTTRRGSPRSPIAGRSCEPTTPPRCADAHGGCCKSS
ncbi:MAG: hypothetical protein HC813_02095 [Planctomycetes bacterium]|nr:hypothetical protein [Planctomycetota bacterium]